MGKWLGRLMVLFGVSTMPAAAAQTGPSAFWNWFEQNQVAYWALDPRGGAATERLFDSLAEQLEKIDPDLVFEFSPVIDGKREFVISAGGIRTAFPSVTALVAAAPSLPDWKITAFRPRRSPMNVLEYQGLRLDPNGVYVQIARDDHKLALRIFIPGYKETERDRFGSAGYLLLDEALGEYDVETKVGSIDFQPLGSTQPSNSVTFSGLAAVFDQFFAETIH